MAALVGGPTYLSGSGPETGSAAELVDVWVDEHAPASASAPTAASERSVIPHSRRE
jgi:hypothetical protein